MPGQRSGDVGMGDQASDVAAHVREFVADVVVPAEARLIGRDAHGVPDELRVELQDEARQAGLLAPSVGRAWGGLGLGHRDRAPVFEEAGYSPLGPIALNCSAPDEGNMHLLEQVATEAQKQRFLPPLVMGEIRSAFAMTEPPPGAGSDPQMLRTTARPIEDGWSITGTKWYITGAIDTGLWICMARTGGEEGAPEATMFLLDGDHPGVEIVRQIGSMDRNFVGGHAEVRFDNVVVGPDAVLGEVGRGFAYAQVRLGPARLTHCMRWLGAARRAHDVAIERSCQRSAFGQQLTELGMVQQHIADNIIDIAASRALIHAAGEELDAGHRASEATSVAKVFVSEAVSRVIDRAVQLCGSAGVSDDLVLARLYADVRPFRIYDGPSEVHRWSLAKRAVRQHGRPVAET
jgi:acyl-CoA dehydrogenase